MDVIRKYFTAITTDQAAIEWRMHCYESGWHFVHHIKDNYFPLEGRRVLDIACAWGGHALAFADAGASVVGVDINDHCFDNLNAFCKENNINFFANQGNCQALTFPDTTFDVILVLDLIEHIPSPEKLAREVARLLKPGGVCILTTPSKFKSVFWGEPHWHLRGLSLLPFRWQGFVAKRLFGREYPYPIERQYIYGRQIGNLFMKHSLQYRCVITSKKAIFWGLQGIEKLFWSFIVIDKPQPEYAVTGGL